MMFTATKYTKPTQATTGNNKIPKTGIAITIKPGPMLRKYHRMLGRLKHSVRSLTSTKNSNTATNAMIVLTKIVIIAEEIEVNISMSESWKGAIFAKHLVMYSAESSRDTTSIAQPDAVTAKCVTNDNQKMDRKAEGG